jgi:hypothetical protein
MPRQASLGGLLRIFWANHPYEAGFLPLVFVRGQARTYTVCPQGLKPGVALTACGTTKVVP